MWIADLQIGTFLNYLQVIISMWIADLQIGTFLNCLQMIISMWIADLQIGTPRINQPFRKLFK